MKQPAFKLFRSTTTVPGHPEYVGSITTPRGELLLIEARVVEHDFPPTGKGKHFEGEVFGASTREGQRAILRGAKVEGSRDALPQEVLVLVDPPEFDDPLPPLEPPAVAGGST